AFRRSRLIAWLSENAMPAVASKLDALATRLERLPQLGSGADTETNRVLSGIGRVALIVLFGGAAVWGIVSIFQLLAGLTADDWLSIAPAAGATFLRTAIALLLGTAWT